MPCRVHFTILAPQVAWKLIAVPEQSSRVQLVRLPRHTVLAHVAAFTTKVRVLPTTSRSWLADEAGKILFDTSRARLACLVGTMVKQCLRIP